METARVSGTKSQRAVEPVDAIYWVAVRLFVPHRHNVKLTRRAENVWNTVALGLWEVVLNPVMALRMRRAIAMQRFPTLTKPRFAKLLLQSMRSHHFAAP